MTDSQTDRPKDDKCTSWAPFGANNIITLGTPSKKNCKKNDIMQKGGGVESESFHLEPPRPSYYVNFFCSFPLMILIVNCWER